MDKKLLTGFAILFVAVAALILFLAPWRGGPKDGSLDDFAKCVAGKGIVMYGASWCPHCQNEKRAFGSSFQYVTYVECTEDVARCTRDGIRAFPTWDFGEGRRHEGELGLLGVARESGCVLPRGLN